jgi:hypothetical protein
MKIWLDDVRPAPITSAIPDDMGWKEVRSVNQAKKEIIRIEKFAKWDKTFAIELIDCDHDLGSYASDGGDGIKLLDWLEETGRNYPIRIHSANPVGVANMRRIIERNGWKEIK